MSADSINSAATLEDIWGVVIEHRKVHGRLVVNK